ncbi:MAG: RNase adapter RapZ [Gammaproteobacteria bacterium SHHR-1]|uniref:RNase adapter RapZ n=1 Tax=Magnetovirga frankeli TaxID=947516 RepID=UPI001293F4C3|nr:RNase adapter RapZ [gamma proteobacterium SS-5]
MKLVIVTGLSGAGKSIALDTLEDLGLFCVDNLPIPLLPALGEELLKASDRNRYSAVGIDARSEPQNLQRMPQILGQLQQQGFDCEIFFLTADDDTLLKRFSETRRKHPLTDTTGSLAEAIALERRLLGPLMERADLRIDTCSTHVHQLRHLLRDRFKQRVSGRLSLQFLSFGFKHGSPSDADFIFDLRCLPNPHWQPALRPLTGKDAAVVDFLEDSPLVLDMRQDLIAFLQKWINAFDAEGRSYLTLALGCTGGQHRSVYMAEALFKHFNNGERHVSLRHREGP